MKIAIRGGHNEQAIGAKALLDEVTEDRKIYAFAIKYLKLAGHDVLDVTPGRMDSSSDLAYGVNKANAWGADLFASIHLNKAYNSYTGALGTEVFVYSKTDQYNDEVYAQRVVDKLASLGFKNRGVKTNTALYELKNTKMSAMIVECFFLEATEDVALYKKLGAEALGKAIAEGIVGKSISEPQPTPSISNLYRVRKSWEDAKSQIGAFADLNNAIDLAKKNAGYKVYDSNKNQVYPQVVNTNEMYRIRKTWADAKTQKGAYTNLNSAKAVADHYASEGYKVFNASGQVVYTPSVSSQVESPQVTPQPTQPTTPSQPQEVPQPTSQVKIMGDSCISAKRMAKLLLEKNKEPKIDVSALEFATMFLEEGAKEGVRGDIAFCQAMHETGWLKFGNQVLAEQHNYSGIGATNNSGVGKGAWFKDEREGIRAQIQHLKAYASKDSLTQECVDPRFNLVTRGIAPNWTDLNGRWAVPGTTYGQSILALYDLLLKMDEPVEEAPQEPVEEPKDEQVVEDEESLIKSLGQVIAEFIAKLVKLIFKGENK